MRQHHLLHQMEARNNLTQLLIGKCAPCGPALVMASIAGLLWSTAAAQQTPPDINLAPAAVATASYVSGDTSVAAINDGVKPDNSRDNREGCYGNWNRTGTQWVQYDWNQPISTGKIEVYWWADGGGRQYI